MRYVFILIAILSLSCAAYGEDMRAVYRKARAEYERALADARASEAEIFKDRASLERGIAGMKEDIESLKSDIAAIEDELKQWQQREVNLSHHQTREETGMQELASNVRVVARDLQTILMQSQFSPRFQKRLEMLAPILDKDRFPGIEDIRTIVNLFFQEMALSGEVVLQEGLFVDRSGLETAGDILTIGKFTAAYRTGKEIGFLSYSPKSGRFYALPALPSWWVRRSLQRYMQGKTDDVYLDISGGAALRQITHRLGLADQIRSGGPLVWPILAIGVFAVLIVIERLIFLKSVHVNTDRIMGTVNELVSQGKWNKAREILQEKKGRPVCNVLEAGLEARDEERETLDSILQEAILRELPRLERFLPTLNIMGAIAPLLGLLGTVTGMISTFHVITLYGTGDPRMMSGGISEALVTTMLGLAVAIPIMLMHAFLSHRVDTIAGDMEEKAVALSNIIYRQRTL